MIQWHYVTSAEFKLGEKVETDLYFLKDTREIYRGSVPFNESVIMYTELPVESIATNRLYIDSTTLEGKIHNGSSWKTVIRPIADTVDPQGENPVSAKAVAAYVAAELANVSASSDAVSTLSWDSVEHILTVTKGDASEETITFDGLGVSLSYVSATGELQLLDSNGAKIGDPINLPLEKFVYSGEYNAETEQIILYFDAEKTNSVTIDASALVDVYTGGDTGSASVSVSAGNVITATVKVSAEGGNQVVLKSDGIYVSAPDLSSKMDLVDSPVDGHILTVDSTGQAVDSGKTFDDLATAPAIFQGSSLEEATSGQQPKKGDLAVVSKVINGEKVEKTAYHYDGENWVAFDGNYSAENVYWPDDLITTVAVGNIALNNGQATVPVAGKNLVEWWNAIFLKEKNPTITQPSVSVSMPQAKAYEVGTTVTPSFSATLNPGNYQYGPATGITASSWAISDTADHSADTNTGSFDAFQVEDGTNYRITAVAQYGDGAIPKTNTGNDYASGQIKAGSKTGNSGYITGFRAGFYGVLSTKDGAIDSALVRSLGNKTSAAPAQNNTWSINLTAGTQRVVFAYPATLRDVSSVKDVNGMNAEIKTAFTKYDVDVEGAEGYTAASYKVYVYDLAEAITTPNTFTVTI